MLQSRQYYLNLIRRLPYGILRRATRKKCFGYATMRPLFHGKYGLEVGGPSRIFGINHLIPVYSICRRIDACNFSSGTIWSGSRDSKEFGPSLGKFFASEASSFSMIPDETYDFVLASHVLEHIANPLRALHEWKRILVPLGTVLVVVPHKHGTFDHRRPFTTIDHIEADFRANTTEDDLSHLEEVLALHDLSLDPPAGSQGHFRERCLRNSSVRAIHHHVFSPEVLVAMFTGLQMRIVNLAVESPFHIIICAEKTILEERLEIAEHNQGFVSESAGWRAGDPFRYMSKAGSSN